MAQETDLDVQLAERSFELRHALHAPGVGLDGPEDGEACPKGRTEGSPIEGYVVEDHADGQLGEFETQDEAIRWAESEGHVPHVARVRHLNDRKKPDQWRPA